MKPLSLQETINLSQKVAIVTGGAMGIGYGIAYRLAEAGASVIIADTNKKAADESAQKLISEGWKAASIEIDVSNSEHVSRMIQFTVETFGGVDILVNNAGIYPNTPMMQMDENSFDRVLAVNLKSTFMATKAAAAQMIKQGRGGKIINITSVDALHPSMVGLAAYDSSKHGMWGFTKNTALELAPHHIWVNAIAPGGVATPGTGMGAGMTPEMSETMKPFLNKIPMRRMGEADEIGKVALFLASDLSSYMTGAQVVVDGGVLLA